jgi:hypothetical protein
MNTPEGKLKQSLAQDYGYELVVTDLLTNSTIIYTSIRRAARELNIDRHYILHFINLNQTKPVLDRYLFAIKNEDKKRLTNFDKVLTQPNSKPIKIVDIISFEECIYPSIGAAARELGIRQSSISTYLKSYKKKPFKNQYLISFL